MKKRRLPRYHTYGLLTARFFVDMVRSVVDGSHLGLDDALIGTALLVGQLEGRPMSATKLAAYVGIPRPTVIRKLQQMKAQGIAVQDGKSWRMAVEKDYISEKTKEAVDTKLKLIRKVSTELSILDAQWIEKPIKRT